MVWYSVCIAGSFSVCIPQINFRTMRSHWLAAWTNNDSFLSIKKQLNLFSPFSNNCFIKQCRKSTIWSKFLLPNFWSILLEQVYFLACIYSCAHTYILLCAYVEGYGDWSTEGCVRGEYNESDAHVTCYCTHLSSFTILLVSPPLLQAAHTSVSTLYALLCSYCIIMQWLLSKTSYNVAA